MINALSNILRSRVLVLVLFMLVSTILGAQKDTIGGPVLNSAPAVTPEIVEKGLDDKINEAIKPATDLISSIVFYAIPLPNGVNFPLVLLLLVGGALYFTLYFGFVNFRHFGTAIQTVRGKYADKVAKGADEVDAKGSVNVLDSGDIARTVANEGAHGEVSHFQALSAALSATVGLGNIAGVAVAITLGGPGATFWMILAGFLGMSSKFVECTLGVKYRDIGPDGTVYGGPMYYLSKGFAERGANWAVVGKVFAVFFAIMCVGGSFGGGNMFQANQAAAQLQNVTGFAGGNSGAVFGIIMALLVAVVIIGGIKRIGRVAETIVPFMAILYVGAALIILVVKANELPHAFQLIFEGAFTAAGVTGGVVGVLFQGFKRAAFSNEAGVGSAAIAHSAVKTKYPASEGVVSLLEPFIDTVVICTMTALVLVVTNNYSVSVEGTEGGVALTSIAFDSTIPGFRYILTIAVVLFAFSTMLSWSYYGLQAWKYLFGKGKGVDIAYKIIFCVFVVIGAAANLGPVIDFSDAMIFAMVFPNIIGLIVMAPVVKAELARYIKVIKG